MVLYNKLQDIKRGIGTVGLEAFDVFNNLKLTTQNEQPFSAVDAWANINASVDVMHLMQNASKIQNTLLNESVLSVSNDIC